MALLDYYLSPATVADIGVPFTLENYFTGINNHDYRYVWQQFSPREQRQFSVAQLAAGVSSVQDTGIEIHSIKLVNAKTAVAYVTFDSTQDARQGPNGDTSDSWTLDYRMVAVAGEWLIDLAGPHDDSTHSTP
jgi:uncharacterized protein YchJ